MTDYVATKFRSNNKVHSSFAGCSATACCTRHARIAPIANVARPITIHASRLCERCFGTNPSPEFLALHGIILAD